MNRDPFLRLALIALCSLYVLGVVLVAVWLGFWLGFLVYGAGTIVAAMLTVELEPGTVSVPQRWRRHRQPADGTRGFERIE